MDSVKLKDKIGEGAHGVVYLAEDLESGAEIAIKKFTLRHPQNGLPVRLIREINAMHAMTTSKHVIRLLKCFAHGPSIWLCMPLCRYRLRDVIRALYRNGPQQNEHATGGLCAALSGIVKRLVRMLTQGMAELHGCRIAHRDLAPKNILVDAQGCLKICDLSLAVLCPDGGSAGHKPKSNCDRPESRIINSDGMKDTLDSAHSSPVDRCKVRPGRNYKAPEFLIPRQVASQQRTASASCDTDFEEENETMTTRETSVDEIKGDLWSLGCVIWEMKCGKELFKKGSDLHVLNSIFQFTNRRQEYVEKNFKKDKLADLANCVLQIDPNMRKSAPQLLHEVYFYSKPVAAHISQVKFLLDSL